MNTKHTRRGFTQCCYPKGFTLIELLVVVLIIGILAAVAIPQYKLAVEKAHATQALTMVRALALAEKSYYLASGKYTKDLNNLDLDFEGTSWEGVIMLKGWYLSPLLADSTTAPRVFAARYGNGYTENNGKWYVVYLLNTNELYCAAEKTDIQANRVCKTFGEGYTCPHNTQQNCYPIPS